MITWGARGNPNQQQWQSLGAIATGNAHTFTRYRTGSDGASLHPLQRSGQVSAGSHTFRVRQNAIGPVGLGNGPPVPYVDMTLPPVVPLMGRALTPFTV